MTEAHVAIADLFARGLIEQQSGGIRLTAAGESRAASVWAAMPDSDKMLLIPYLRRLLHVVFEQEGKP